MEETILLKILEVQNEILAELRLVRRALTTEGAMTTVSAEPVAAPMAHQPAPEPIPQAPQPVAAAPTPEPAAAPQAPAPEPAPADSPRPGTSGGMLTLDDLADLGGQFLDNSPRRKARVKPVDASDLSGSILDEIKAKNRAKRSAFAEFDKFNRDR